MKPKMNKMTELLIIKSILNKNPDLYIATKNKETGWEGCASFYRNQNVIKVYEGDGSGKDDKEYNYQEFLNKYSYEVKRED